VTWSERPSIAEEIGGCIVKGEELDYPSEVSSFSCDISSEV